MHILTLTTLFPSLRQPVHGLFIRARMEDFTKRYGHRWTVVAPVPFYPRLPFPTSRLYDNYARVPAFEDGRGYPVHHPRFLVIPKTGLRWQGPSMAKAIGATVRAIHARDPIDLIDGHYIYPDAEAALEAGRITGAPVLLSARGTDLNLYPSFPAIRKRIVANLAACSHLICVCTELKRAALDLGIEEAKVSVIGNGVDTAKFRPLDRSACRAKLGLPQAERIILSVGHLVERKGFHILLQAFTRLPDRSGLRVVICGDGEYRKTLTDLAHRLGIESQVTFAGAVGNEALPEWYSSADLFVMASSREGWPNAVCEALACGLPVIGTKVWGMPEILTDASLGILVEERTPEAFAEALRRALGMQWDRAGLSAHGSKRTWEDVSRQMLPIFETLEKRRTGKTG